MFRNTRDNLISKPFEASIGEPWDFQSMSGQNKLIGAIVAISDANSDVDWLLMEVNPFQYKGNEIRQVVGVNRYKSSQDIFGQLLVGKSTTLNFMFTTDGHELKGDTVLSELATESKFSFLIGSMSRK